LHVAEHKIKNVCKVSQYKVFCVRVGRAENKAKQFSRSLMFAFDVEFPRKSYFERENRIVFVLALPTQTQSTLQ
jgi:hypothetical protein